MDIQYTDKKDMIEMLNEYRKIKLNALYQHFKGALYLVENVATNSETMEEMVVYRQMETGHLFVRPLSMFMDIKETEKGFTYRFSKYDLDNMMQE